MLPLRNPLRRISDDERGMSMIEFGMLAPILAIFVIGIGDLGRGLSERFSLQQAANRTLELAHFGTTEPTYNYLIAEAAAAADVPATNVTLDDWVECDGVRNEDFGAACAANQQIARYIKLTINSSFEPLFSGFNYATVGADGRVQISADASLRVQ